MPCWAPPEAVIGRFDLDTAFGRISIVNGCEAPYPSRIVLGDERPTSFHGVWLDGEPRALIEAAGGGSGVHRHSAVVREERMFVGCGKFVASFSLETLGLVWSLEVDPATCFGVYQEPARGALIAHGELAISRFTPEGAMLWQSFGRDIFTGPFRVSSDIIEAVDFDGVRYRVSVENGESTIVGRTPRAIAEAG